jgi:hypothetical protein
MRLGLGLGLGVAALLPSWTPAKIGSSLVEWLEGDSMTVSGGHVTSWADKSGRGVTIAEATHPPVYSAAALNGHDAASFDTNQVLGAAAQLFTTTFTIAAVLRPRAAGGGPMVTNGNSTTGVELLEGANRIVQLNNVADCSGAALVQGWEVWVARRTAAPLTSLQVNGTDDPLSGSTAGIVAPAASSRLTLGGRWSGSAYTVFANVDVAALLVCNAALDDPTTLLLTTYLRKKYAL